MTSVIIDDQKMEAHICDVCSDDASPRMIKAVLIERASRVEELQGEAAKFGYKLVPINQVMKKNDLAKKTIKHPKNLPQLSETIDGDDSGYEIEDVEVQNIESQNAAIQIPSKIKTTAGETVISIKQTDDSMIQRRTQAIARESMEEGGNILQYSKGYDVKDCPLCFGVGKTQNGRICQKCNGEGLLSRH